MYFVEPFASAGDRTAIPLTTPVDGSVSYTDGYGPNYQLNPNTDPSALDIERDKANELSYEITLALQRLQQFYAPDWISSAANGSSPFAYNNGAIVLFTDGNYWQSIAATNTTTPNTDPSKWILFLSNYATGVALAAETARAEAAEAALATGVTQAAPPGAVMAFAVAAVPAGWLACDGTSYLRSAQPALFAYIGTTYGAADGTHFSVPDFRGMFLRGFFGGISGAYGTEQLDAVQGHTHLSGVATTSTTDTDIYGSSTTGVPGAASAVFQRQNSTPASQPIGGPMLTGRTDAETRPVNFAVNWCIKT